MISRRLLMSGTLGAGIAAATRGVAVPQGQPPGRIVVALLPGTSPDIIARSVAEALSARQRPFIVENRPGAGGLLGAEAVARAAPDGQTLLVALGTTFTVSPSLHKKPGFDPLTDFAYISTLANAVNMLVVHPSVPVDSVSEFVSFAKRQPVVYAHGGPGTPGHLCMEYFRLLAGFDAVPVPYRGNTQLATDLAAGQVKFGFVGASGVLPHVRAGRLKGLAVSSRARSALMPDLPTIAESGYPEFEFETYYVLAGPARLAEPLVSLLESEVRDALDAPELKARLGGDVVIAWKGRAATKARIEADCALWAGLVKRANLRID